MSRPDISEFVNESPQIRRSINIQIDEVHYQWLLELGGSPEDALHLADRILNQQMAEEIKLKFFLNDDYKLHQKVQEHD